MAAFAEGSYSRSPFYYGDINLDGDNSGVQAGIIATQLVNKLAVSTHRIVNGVHSSATSSFIRACMAFCYISIPSLEHPLHKLQLYILCAQTAYLNQSLSQG